MANYKSRLRVDFHISYVRPEDSWDQQDYSNVNGNVLERDLGERKRAIFCFFPFH